LKPPQPSRSRTSRKYPPSKSHHFHHKTTTLIQRRHQTPPLKWGRSQPTPSGFLPTFNFHHLGKEPLCSAPPSLAEQGLFSPKIRIHMLFGDCMDRRNQQPRSCDVLESALSQIVASISIFECNKPSRGGPGHFSQSDMLSKNHPTEITD